MDVLFFKNIVKERLIKRMKTPNFYGEYLNNKPNLFEFLV